MSWKNERISGIVLLVWYALVWISSIWVWINAGGVLVFSTPVSLIGIALIIYSFKK